MALYHSLSRFWPSIHERSHKKDGGSRGTAPRRLPPPSFSAILSAFEGKIPAFAFDLAAFVVRQSERSLRSYLWLRGKEALWRVWDYSVPPSWDRTESCVLGGEEDFNCWITGSAPLKEICSFPRIATMSRRKTSGVLQLSGSLRTTRKCLVGSSWWVIHWTHVNIPHKNDNRLFQTAFPSLIYSHVWNKYRL